MKTKEQILGMSKETTLKIKIPINTKTIESFLKFILLFLF